MDAKPMIDALNKCSAKQLGSKAHLSLAYCPAIRQGFSLDK
jgi:hypothetical protein